MKETIYEKKYDKQLNIELPTDKEICSGLPETGAEFLKMMEENSEYIPNEKKLSNLEVFIENAKIVADIFEFAISIKKHDYFVQVYLEIPDCPFIGKCKKDFLVLLHQADDFSIHRKPDYVLFILTYNTHDRYFNGRNMI